MTLCKRARCLEVFVPVGHQEHCTARCKALDWHHAHKARTWPRLPCAGAARRSWRSGGGAPVLLRQTQARVFGDSVILFQPFYLWRVLQWDGVTQYICCYSNLEWVYTGF